MTDETVSYYYCGGQRMPLVRRDDLVAVKLRGMESSDGVTRSLWAVDLPGLRAPVAEEIWPGGEMILQQLPATTRAADLSDQLRDLNRRNDVEYATPVYEHSPGDSWIVTNQVIAQFSESMAETDIEFLNDYYGVQSIERIAWLPRGRLLQLTPAATLDTLGLANKYVESGHVIFAHPNFRRKYAHRVAALQSTPAQVERHWHLNAIDAFGAWQITTGSPTIIIAIIDDAVDIDHLSLPNQAPAHFNVIDPSDDPRPPVGNAAAYGHGTACAGLAGGAVNQTVGTSGVAPGCRLMAVRLLERTIPSGAQKIIDQHLSGEDALGVARALSVVDPYREARALQWAAEHGAHVISNSWGPPDGYGKYGRAYPMDDIARLALGWAAEHGRDGKGCVVCWAAGNGNESISLDGYASRPEVLAVAACTAQGLRAPYSDFGPEVDITAPGGGYKEDRLTTVAVDTEAHSAYRQDFNGTSAAAPIVAGVAALLLSRTPDLTREEVYDILKETADKIDAAGGQYDSRGHSPYYGYGRVNAARALQEAARRRGA